MNFKRVCALVMAFVLAFTSIDFPVNAAYSADNTNENQIGKYYQVDENGVLPSEPDLEGDSSHHYGPDGEVEENGDIIVDKVISPYGEENMFRIDLKATTRQKVVEPDMAVAFVVDVSTSMDAYYNTANNQTRIEAAQAAMKMFVENFGQVSSDEVKREVAIAKFYVDAGIVVEWVDVTTEAGRQSVYNYIDTLSNGVGPKSDSTADNWGTNIEGGLLLGRNLLSDQEIQDKHVILLSDGGANACVLDNSETGFNSTSNTERPVYYDTSKLDATSYEGSWFYADYHFYHGGAADAAGQIQKQGAELHTVYCGNTGDLLTVGDEAAEDLLSGGSDCPYCEAARKAFDNNDTSLDYKVTGFLDEISDEFVAATNSDDLLDNVMQIANEIGEAWVVTDPVPMGNHIEFVGFVDGQGADTPSGDGFVYNTDAGTVSWDLKAVTNPEEHTIVEGNATITTYTYQLSYYVRLDNVYEGFRENILHNTNNTTSVPYVITMTDHSGNTTTASGNAYFNIPSVKGYVGEFGFTKMGQTEEGGTETEALKGAVFAITHSEDCGCGITLDDENWSMEETSSENGEVSFTNIPSGHKYVLKEAKAPSGYKASSGSYTFSVEYGAIQDGMGDLFAEDAVVVNEKVPTTDVEGEKTWNDRNNASGSRPESITIRLLANGTEVDSQTVTAADDWRWSFTGLPIQDEAGNDIIYAVKEDTVDDYEATYSQDGYDITNTLVETIDISGTKTWSGGSSNNKPESITLYLYANGEKLGEPITVSGSRWQNTWNWSFGKLPKYDENGNEIVYTVIEDVISNYYPTYDKGSFDINNTYSSNKTSVTVMKVWDDANDQDGLRPDSIEVQLLRDNENIETVTLSEKNNWRHTFSDLDVGWRSGKIYKEYTYVVKEKSSVDGYRTAITGNADTAFIITNSHTPEATEATVKKVWDDNGNQDKLRPDSLTVTLSNGTEVVLNEANGWTATVQNLPKYADGEIIEYTWTENELPEGYVLGGTSKEGTVTTLTNIHTPETVEATVEKVWNDDDNNDGKRPTELKVTLTGLDKVTEVTLNEANDWKETVTGLPKYNNGQEIHYTWQEGALPEGYAQTSTSVNGTITTITNTYPVNETVEASVIKVWNDANDQDGKRPESLKVTLSNGTEATLNEANNWTVTVPNLPKYADGEEIVYTWTEGELPEGYELSDTSKEGTVTTLTNSYTPETTEATVKKVWDDNEDQSGFRPDSLTVTLSNGQSVTLNEENGWEATLTNLPKYASGEEIVYTWTEGSLPEGYELSSTSKEGTVTTLTNSYAQESTEATVKKIWDDADDQDGLRPESLTVTLSNGTGVTLNEANNWTATVPDLPKYADGEEIIYTWTEGELPEGYELSSTSKEGTVTTLTNTHTPEKTSVSGSKHWDDNENQDGLRPESIIIRLLADGRQIDTQTVTPDKDGNWSWKFDNLDKYADGKEIVYTVSEDSISGYTTAVSGYDVTNTHTPETISISGNKTWDDNEDQDGLRPNSITIHLLANALEVKTQVVVPDKDGNWSWIFKDLPKYEDGKEIKYTITEDVVAGYTTTVNRYDVTNHHSPETTAVSGMKTWNDSGDQDGVRPDKITINLLADGIKVGSRTVTAEEGWKWSFTGLPKYAAGKRISYAIQEIAIEDYTTVVDGYNVTNTHNPGKTSVPVSKTWNDSNNQDGVRPPSITVKLLADGKDTGKTLVLNADNQWSGVFSELDINAAGKKIEYTVEELTVEGYNTETNGEPEITGDAVNGYVIKNTRTPETVTVEGVKNWEDNEDQDGKRPSELTVILRADGEEYLRQTTNAEKGWKYSFTGLPKYKNEGIEIVYTIGEVAIEGYTPTYSGNDITNTHKPEKTHIDVSKSWNDKDNQDGLRPESIEVKLLADGVDTGKRITLTKENLWKGTFDDLDKMADGTAIVYSIEEVSIPGYQTTYDGDPTNGYTITNTHVPEKISIKGNKIWEDNGNQDGKRPESITVNLFANGTKKDSKTITAVDDWKWEFANLDKYSNAVEIEYTITEDTVPGYTTAVNGYDITNSYTPETITISGSKSWNDGDNQDGVRPKSLTVILKANGEEVTREEITEDNGWNWSFSNLPKYSKGKEINYTISEIVIPGYTTTKEGFDITNSHNPGKVSIDVTKRWEDGSDQDGKRPGSITVNLLADGETTGKTLELNAGNNWTGIFEELDENKNGQSIVYTITEEAIEGYETIITGDAQTGYTITNTHNPETISVNGSKTWEDNNNQDGKRPAEITIRLLADETVIKTVTVTADEGWKWSFADLPKYKDGKEISYSITEDAVPGYTTSVNGYDVTNSYTPETTIVSGGKTWNDAGNQDGIRPESIKIYLLANGEEVDSRTVTAAEDWKWSFTELPKYAKGQEIRYTVKEDKIDGYTTQIQGVNVINNHTPEKISINGNKVWNDKEDIAKARPESIKVELYNGEEKVAETTATAKENWKYSFHDLAKYANGQEIQYTVKEVPVAGYTSEINGYTITNTHTPEPAEAEIQVKKALEGRQWHESDVFEFVLGAEDETTKAAIASEAIVLPDSLTAEATAMNPIPSFGAIVFKEAGTFTFVVSEVKGNDASIIYSDKAADIQVQVTDEDKDGKLNARILTDTSDRIFTNTYKVTPAAPVSIMAEKTVTPSEGLSYELEAGDFSFKLMPAASNPESDPIKTQIVTNEADGKVIFEASADQEYTEAGTYIYTVSEISGDKGGIIYDDTVYTVIAEVSDLDADGKPIGQLSVQMTITKDGEPVEKIVFDNVYLATETSAIIHGHKTLKGDHKSLEVNEAAFEILKANESPDDTPMPEQTVARNDASGDFRFAAIRYTKPGTYTYEIKEVDEGKKGYSYDDTVYTVTVEVTDKDDEGQETGELRAEVTGVQNEKGEQIILFENIYVPNGVEQSLGGKKLLTGRTLKEGEFLFELKDDSGDVIRTAKNTVEGNFMFDSVRFVKEGTYHFTITEKDTAVSGVTYDAETTYQVEVVVTDDGHDGQLDVASVTYMDGFDEVDDESVVFNNSYKPADAVIAIEAAKKLTGRTQKAGEFRFVLEDEQGNKLYAVNDAEGGILFDEIVYSEAGTYVYTVYEEKGTIENVTYDDTVHKIAVIVKDNEEGKLIAEISGDKTSIVFENDYSVPSEPVIPETPEDMDENPGADTGDHSGVAIWMLTAFVSLTTILSIFFRRKQTRK